jgi:GNAT superfamily N-acetyltransferase
MGVLSEFRGHGVAKALIVAAIEKAKAIGLTRVELMVREENKRDSMSTLALSSRGLTGDPLELTDDTAMIFLWRCSCLKTKFPTY